MPAAASDGTCAGGPPAAGWRSIAVTEGTAGLTQKLTQLFLGACVLRALTEPTFEAPVLGSRPAGLVAALARPISLARCEHKHLAGASRLTQLEYVEDRRRAVGHFRV